MILADVHTWRTDLLEFLGAQQAMLLASARHEREVVELEFDADGDYVPTAMRPSNPHFHAHETATQRVLELLQATTLRGWHCTRLTEVEVRHIQANGMQPPDAAILGARIRQVQAEGLISAAIADRLVHENQAADVGRHGMIWFCFFDPRLAGQSGIERFFRRWGGEALYNLHERDPATGAILRTIGCPCLIEVNVLVAAIGRITFLGDKVIRRYLLHCGFDPGDRWEHEDKVRSPIPASNVSRFVFHAEPEFATLTGCPSWTPPL